MPLIYLIQWALKVSILKASDVRLVFRATFCRTLSPRSRRTLDRKKITELLLVAGKPVIFFCIYLTNICLSSVLNSQSPGGYPGGRNGVSQLAAGFLASVLDQEAMGFDSIVLGNIWPLQASISPLMK